MSKTIVFFGNERLATGVGTDCSTLRMLIEQNYDVALIVSHNSGARSRSSRTLEIQKLAEEYKIPILLPEKLSEVKDKIESCKATIGVLVAYGKMVPQSIIDIFPKGIVNIHPSDLPLHRGPTPIESVILDGSKETSVSLMKLVKEMDAGPVYEKETVKLHGNETKQQLSELLLSKGTELLEKNLPKIIAGELEPIPQDSAGATYDKLIDKKAGVIDWTKSAEVIEHEIRAYSGWPGSRTTLAGKDVIITKAHFVPSVGTNDKPGDLLVVPETHSIVISTSNGSLCIEKLKPAGKNEMTSEAFMAGYRNLL